MSEQLTSDQCDHTKVYVTDSVMRRMQVPCPWCKDIQIERLRAELVKAQQLAMRQANQIRKLEATIEEDSAAGYCESCKRY